MTAGRVTADSSVVVPALSDWHENHARSRDAMREVERLPAHVILEAIAAMTRLTGGLAVPTPQVVSALREGSPATRSYCPRAITQRWSRRSNAARCAADRCTTGSWAPAAAVAGLTLLTRDRRAEPTYRAVDAQVSLLA